MEQAAVPGNPDNKGENRSFNSTVFKDFYHSFRHSQGNLGLQKYMFVMLGRFYRQNYFPDSEPDWEDVDKYIGEKLDKLPLPAAHVEITKDKLDEFKKVWSIEKEVLRGVFHPDQITDNDEKWQLQSDQDMTADILLELATREGIFLRRDTGRPFRIPSEDKYQSFLRTYLIEGGSYPELTPGYVFIYDQMRNLLTDLNILDHSSEPARVQRATDVAVNTDYKQAIYESFRSLSDVWNYTHPGQDFYHPQPVQDKAAA